MRFYEAIKLFTKYRSLEKEAKTNEGYNNALRHLCMWLRNPLITQVTADHIVQYVTDMREMDWADNSIMLYCAGFSQFFKFWKRKGYPVFDPELIPKVKKRWKQPKIANVDHLRLVVDYCNKHIEDPYYIRMKAMILLTADTGARNGEICSFNADLDTEHFEQFENEKQYRYIIRNEKSRGRKPFRPVFWYEETNQALKEWLRIRKGLDLDHNALFVNLNIGRGSRNVGQRIRVATFAQAIRNICIVLKIPILNAHSLRHLKGNDLALGGANNSNISNILGHATINSSKIYTDLNDKQIGSVHAKYRRT